MAQSPKHYDYDDDNNNHKAPAKPVVATAPIVPEHVVTVQEEQLARSQKYEEDRFAAASTKTAPETHGKK